MTNVTTTTKQAEQLLHNILQEFGWANYMFFTHDYEYSETPRAIAVQQGHTITLTMVKRVGNYQVPEIVSRALVAYELLEAIILRNTAPRAEDTNRTKIREEIIPEEYALYTSIVHDLKYVEQRGVEPLQPREVSSEESCNVCELSSKQEEGTRESISHEVPPVGESVNNLVEGIKTRSLALLALDILQGLPKQYPWVENAKFEYNGGYVTCVLWRDGVRHTKMAEDNGDSALPAVLLYKTVRGIVGEDIESCVRASSAYNHIIRLWEGDTDRGTINSEYTPEHQLHDAYRLSDILLHDLGTYFYTRVFCNHDKKAVTAIITRGSKKFVGVAKTHVDDTYHPVIGKAVALYKAFQEELKNYALNGVTVPTQETLQYMRKAEELYKKITTV